MTRKGAERTFFHAPCGERLRLFRLLSGRDLISRPISFEPDLPSGAALWTDICGNSPRPATFHAAALTDSSVKERPGNRPFRLRHGRIYHARPFGPALRRLLLSAPGGGFRQVVERKVIAMPKFSRLAVVLVAISSASVLLQTQRGHLTTAPSAAAATGGITFETPSIADPIHTFGEPDIGVDPQGRVFVSGPDRKSTRLNSSH